MCGVSGVTHEGTHGDNPLPCTSRSGEGQGGGDSLVCARLRPRAARLGRVTVSDRSEQPQLIRRRIPPQHRRITSWNVSHRASWCPTDARWSARMVSVLDDPEFARSPCLSFRSTSAPRSRLNPQPPAAPALVDQSTIADMIGSCDSVLSPNTQKVMWRFRMQVTEDKGNCPRHFGTLSCYNTTLRSSISC